MKLFFLLGTGSSPTSDKDHQHQQASPIRKTPVAAAMSTSKNSDKVIKSPDKKKIRRVSYVGTPTTPTGRKSNKKELTITPKKSSTIPNKKEKVGSMKGNKNQKIPAATTTTATATTAMSMREITKKVRNVTCLPFSSVK